MIHIPLTTVKQFESTELAKTMLNQIGIATDKKHEALGPAVKQFSSINTTALDTKKIG